MWWSKLMACTMSLFKGHSHWKYHYGKVALSGVLITPAESQYIWLSFSGDTAINNSMTDGLLPLVEAIMVMMKHNASRAHMVLGKGRTDLHYEELSF